MPSPLLTIHELLEFRTGENPNAVALLTPGKLDSSFSEINAQVVRARELLAHLGVASGSRCGLLFTSRDLLCSTHLAVTSFAVSAPLNQMSTDDEIRTAIVRLRLDWVFVERGMEPRFREIALAAGAGVIDAIPTLDQAGALTFSCDETRDPEPLRLSRPEDVALLLQTSGTTSEPKIVPFRHDVCVRSFGTDGTDVGLVPSDRSLDTMPLHHVQGLNVEFLSPLLAGGSVVLADFNPGSFLNLLEKYQPTFFTLVPSMHQAVLDANQTVEHSPVSSLRFVRSSSSTLSPSLRKKIQVFYGVFVNEGYGSSETGNMADFGVDPKNYREGSVGRRCHPGVVVMDDEGNPLENGNIGEICVLGPTVFKGYDGNSAMNEAAFRNGYYRTGDSGYFDSDDYLFLTGRLVETISRGGETLSPQEVDYALMAHEGVAAAAAFGVPHEVLGQEVWAAVVRESGASAEPTELRSFVAQRLSFSKVPKRIVIVDKLPTNDTGKIMRNKLTDRFGEP